MKFLSDLAGTLRTALGIGRASISSAELTEDRTYTLPDLSGKIWMDGYAPWAGISDAPGAVTTTVDGFMTAADKVKLNRYPATPGVPPTNHVIAAPAEASDGPLELRALVNADMPVDVRKFTTGLHLQGPNVYRLFGRAAPNTAGNVEVLPTLIETSLDSPAVLELGNAFTIDGMPIEQLRLRIGGREAVPANRVYASPATGSGGTTFRALHSNDLPNVPVDKVVGVLPVEKGGTGNFEWNPQQFFFNPSTSISTPPRFVDIGETADILQVPQYHRMQAHIEGLELTVASGNTVSVSAGSAYVPGVNQIIYFNGGTNTTSQTANTWNHIYLVATAGSDIGTIERATIAPIAYFGNARRRNSAGTLGTHRRYLGSVRTAGSANVLRPFTHNSENGLVRWMVNSGTDMRVVAGLQSVGTWTSTSCAAFVPVTSTEALVRFQNTGTDGNLRTGTSDYQIPLLAVSGQREQEALLPLNASQAFVWDTTLTSNCWIDIRGYYFKR